MKRTQRFTRIAIAVACLATLAFLIVGAVKHWAWTGFDKPLYDWMQLLIIPVVLALVAVWFNRIDKKNEQTVTTDSQQEQALQGYLDRMSELLLEKNLRESKLESEARNIARARTLTVLPRLDTTRKASLLIFLYESNLIGTDTKDNVISLQGANFNNVELPSRHLVGINLSGCDLSGANLRDCNLSSSDLSGCNLSGANLSHSYLDNTNLSAITNTITSITVTTSTSGNQEFRIPLAHKISTKLDKVNLYKASLRNVNLYGAIITNSNIVGADFSGTSLKDVLLNGTIGTKELMNEIQEIQNQC